MLEQTKSTILLVEDDPADVRLIHEMIMESASNGFRLRYASSVSTAKEQLTKNPCDLILLNLSLPDSDGYETIGHIQSHSPETPIIVLAGLEDKELAERAVREGAEDYLIKGEWGGDVLRRSIRYAISRVYAKKKLRESEARYFGLFEDSPVSLWREDFSDIKAYIDHLREGGVEDLRSYFESKPEAVRHCAELAKLAEVNRATLRMFKADNQEQIIGKLAQIFDESTYPIFREELLALAEGKRTFEAEIVVHALDGDKLYAALRLSLPPGYENTWSKVLISLTDITERKHSEDRIQLQLSRLHTLHRIDTAISGSLDLRVTLNAILDEVTTSLAVDAADILLYDPHAHTVDFAAGRGFTSERVRHTSLPLGQGYAGRVALERKLICAERQPRDGREPLQVDSPLFKEENFSAYFGVPLESKGNLKGVLEIFHCSRLEADREWSDFLETLAGRAAIAIEDARMFDDLHRAHTELNHAYDATLVGWVKALDIRDKETEGHTQRVTEMTVRLAQAMGLDAEELADIRRGALLHDIGKLGIPDSILLKEGELTEKEWITMKKHPVYAFQWLSPIKYLRPAIEIPYCHHEKWDGTGYPRGLKGEEIPLAARIFAVVDVWDALSSDRPYRKAWPEDEVRDHIAAGVLTHFDPQVAEEFLRLKI